VGTNIVGSLTFLHVDEGEEDPSGGQTDPSAVLRISSAELILLFDNTYSWFKPKHIRLVGPPPSGLRTH
jgi:hypothetical protein